MPPPFFLYYNSNVIIHSLSEASKEAKLVQILTPRDYCEDHQNNGNALSHSIELSFKW